MINPIQSGGPATPVDPDYHKDQYNLEKDLAILNQAAHNLQTSDKSNFEDAKQGFEKALKRVLNDYNGNGKGSPDLSREDWDFLTRTLGHLAGGTSLFTGESGDYKVNKKVLNSLTVDNLHDPDHLWLQDLISRMNPSSS